MTTEAPKPEPVDYPVVDRDDATIRAFKDDVLAHLGAAAGRRALARRVLRRAAAHAGLPAGGRGARRPHPGRGERPVGPRRGRGRHVQDRAPSWRRSTSRSRGSSPSDDVVAYCRIGERSSHTWFVLTHLLGFEQGAQLRRQLDGVGQHRPRADRAGHRAGIGAGPMTSSSRPCHRSSPSWSTSSPRSGPRDRLQLLLELSQELPELPERYADAAASMEQVPECQSPLFLAVEVEPAGDRRVHLFFSAPPEAPTTRGFASILRTGLDGEPAADVLAVPDDFYVALGLGQAVSPLRLRGMAAMLARIKRQVRRRGGLSGHLEPPSLPVWGRVSSRRLPTARQPQDCVKNVPRLLRPWPDWPRPDPDDEEVLDDPVRRHLGHQRPDVPAGLPRAGGRGRRGRPPCPARARRRVRRAAGEPDGGAPLRRGVPQRRRAARASPLR